MGDTFGKTMVKMDISPDRKKLVLTDSEGETYTFKHDPRCQGSGVIIGIDGDILKIIGTKLYATTLKSEESRYSWCFFSYEGEHLASVWWSGEAGGYYGDDYNLDDCE